MSVDSGLGFGDVISVDSGIGSGFATTPVIKIIAVRMVIIPPPF